jgi:hypothetical protein
VGFPDGRLFWFGVGDGVGDPHSRQLGVPVGDGDTGGGADVVGAGAVVFGVGVGDGAACVVRVGGGVAGGGVYVGAGAWLAEVLVAGTFAGGGNWATGVPSSAARMVAVHVLVG